MRLRAKRSDLQRYFLVCLCLLVFLFAFHAKLEKYGSNRGKAHPSAASKLCSDTSTWKPVFPVLILLWASARSTYRLLHHGEPLVQMKFGALVAHDDKVSYQRLFLRPPPLFSHA